MLCYAGVQIREDCDVLLWPLRLWVQALWNR